MHHANLKHMPAVADLGGVPRVPWNPPLELELVLSGTEDRLNGTTLSA